MAEAFFLPLLLRGRRGSGRGGQRDFRDEANDFDTFELRRFYGSPLTPTLSPLVPRGEREKKRGLHVVTLCCMNSPKPPRFITHLALGVVVAIVVAQFCLFTLVLEMIHDSARRSFTPVLLASGLGCVVVWVLIAFLSRTGRTR